MEWTTHELTEETPKNRLVLLDAARAAAIISITLNHAVNRSYKVYSTQYFEYLRMPLYGTVAKVLLHQFSRIGVPLFLMITGALLLPRDYESKEGAGRFLKHNWLQLLITTELWLAIMFWYKQVLPGSVLASEGLAVCLLKFVKTLLFLDPVTMGSMWYMPMILCVYLMIPILSIALKRIDRRYFILPMLIVTVCSFVLPDLNSALYVLSKDFKTVSTTLESANVFSMYLVYVLAGYFISSGALEKMQTRLVILLAAMMFGAFCVYQFWFFSIPYNIVIGKDYDSFLNLYTAVFIFEVFRRARYGEKTGALATRLSRIAFGIYFVHICIMEGLVALIGLYSLAPPPFLKCAILEIPSFFGSILVIEVFKKYPWVKKHLFVIK